MKVNGASSSGGVAPTAGGRARASGEGFSVSDARASGTTAPAARTADAAPVAGLDALLAMQEATGPLDRRKRAVRRASKILDQLDKIKLALLDNGAGAASALSELAGAVQEARGDTTDLQLEQVLNEIETRAAVELAKQEMSQRAI